MKVFLLLVALSFPVAAQDDHAALMKDQPAPFSGILVKEDRFSEYLTLELQIESLLGKLEIQENLVSNIERVYSIKLEAATRPERWYESANFHMIVGFIVGVGVTVAIFYGGAELAKSVN